MMQIKVSDQKPLNFQPKMEASACYLELDNHILFIQQGKDKTDEGRWGVPAGKLEQGESPEMAAKRELFEETGIPIQSPSQFLYLGTLYVRKPDLDYIYHMFTIHLDQRPPIRLSFEHSNYRWVKTEDLKNLPLRPGVKEALQYYRNGSPHWPKNRSICAEIDLCFAPAEPTQRSLIHYWLDQKYIKEWIHGDGLQSTLNGLEKFFQGISDTTYWIGYDQDIPFVFLITSPEGKEAITLDLFICNLNYLGKGLSVGMIQGFLVTHFPHVKRVLIDPEATNTRAIHVYQKVGFKIIGEFIANWHPVPHYQMELHMKDLLEEKMKK
jgi:8-oxo-dGTP pyrophosphatase MutT (NUDIX family)